MKYSWVVILTATEMVEVPKLAIWMIVLMTDWIPSVAVLKWSSEGPYVL